MKAARIAAYAALTPFVALTLLPFVYLLSLSLQSDAEIFAGYPPFFPASPAFENYGRIWEAGPFGRFILNSLIVAGVITLSHLFFDPLAGYVFAKYRFPLRDVLFLVVLGTMMIPFFVRMIPLYLIVARVGWVNTYPGLIFPFLMSAYGIFLMRQFIKPLPRELVDAAQIDGAGEFRTYWQVILPQCRPALATLGLFAFVFQWNEFLWPLVATNSMLMRTMPLGLALFNREYFTQWNLVATGAVFMVIPCLALFLMVQRHFTQGVVLSGLK